MEGPKILVVEHEPNSALEIRNSLQNLGYSVHEITDYQEETVKKITEINPNLVIVNNYLTWRIDGMEIADMIQKNFHVPVLYLTKHLDKIRLDNNLLIKPPCQICEQVNEKYLGIAAEVVLHQKEIDKKLQQEKQNLLAIIHSMGCGIVTTDAQGNIQIINQVTEAFLGCNENEVRGKQLAEVLTLFDKEIEEVVEYPVAEVVEANKILNLPENCILINKNSEQMPISGSLAPIHSADGKISGIVLMFQDISQRKQTEAQLLRNAFYDSLTGLPNRVFFLKKLNRRFERSKRRQNYRFAVLFLDLDGFKEINDSFGHSSGDDLLTIVAQRLESCLRSGDTVARFGGDEFAVLLEEIKDITDATNVAKRIQESLTLPLHLEGNELFISASIGIALNNDEYELPDDLLRDADIAMYRAKKQGKANYAVFA